MRQRILVFITALLLGSVVSAIGVLAHMNRKAAIRSFREQQEVLVRFAVSNVELGVSTGRIDVVRNFLNDLASNPLFAGAVVYDADADPILTVPSGFELPPSLEELVFAAGNVAEDDFSYQSGQIVDEDGEVLGHFVLAISFESMNREALRALGLTALIGLLILLPVTILIAWLLAWMERKLRARELRLREVNREIEIILNNLDQGIFTFNLDGSVNPQHSLRAQQLFATTDFQNSSLGDIFGADEKTLAVLRQWISMMSEPRFFNEWQKYEKLNPIPEITNNQDGRQQILTINYRPIIEDQTLQRVMVLGTDVTHQRESEEALERTRQAQQSDMARILTLVRNDSSSIDAFLEDLERCLEHLSRVQSEDHSADDVAEAYRDFHTLKGNAGSFGLSDLARVAENLEQMVITTRGGQESVALHEWQARRAELRAELEKITEFRTMLFLEGKDRMTISRPEYEELLHDVRIGTLTDPDLIRRRLSDLDSQPFGSFCGKYERVIEIYRQRYRKNIVDLKVETPDRQIHRTLMAGFDPCIIHLIRNAADHGIESDREREAEDKGPGVISIGLEISHGTACVTVSDNGRGIDPDVIVQTAIARNLINQEDASSLSRRDKIDVVFLPGFSTRTETGDISGRGVGLDAVKAYIERRGGTVSLDSRVDSGLTVVLMLPHDLYRVAEDS